MPACHCGKRAGRVNQNSNQQQMENHGFISLVGGMFLLLYGFRLMVDCLRESTAEPLRKLLRNITNNRLRGFGVGVVVSSVTQSSTVGTVP